jgi:hypothetical protein
MRLVTCIGCHNHFIFINKHLFKWSIDFHSTFTVKMVPDFYCYRTVICFSLFCRDSCTFLTIVLRQTVLRALWKLKLRVDKLAGLRSSSEWARFLTVIKETTNISV